MAVEKLEILSTAANCMKIAAFGMLAIGESL